MEIKFVEGFTVMHNKMDIDIMFHRLEKQASEDISSCLARIRHEETKLEEFD